MAQAHDETFGVEVHRHPPPRIVIIGGGFAGIAATRALRRCDAEIVLIDRRNHNIFQPLLYQQLRQTIELASVLSHGFPQKIVYPQILGPILLPC